MRDSWYDTAQVCLNGHTVNRMSVSQPQRNKSFCDKCGAPTISTCQSCGAPIQGYYHVPGFIGVGKEYYPPSFCHNCGKPYPWTDTALQAARQLADELHDLTQEERETLKHSLDDLVADTPRTALAATRFKKLVAKAGPVVADAFKQILVDVITESAKQLIWP